VIGGGNPFVESINEGTRLAVALAMRWNQLTSNDYLMTLAECFQVPGERVQFLIVQLHGWHQGARFDGVGISNP